MTSVHITKAELLNWQHDQGFSYDLDGATIRLTYNTWTTVYVERGWWIFKWHSACPTEHIGVVATFITGLGTSWLCVGGPGHMQGRLLSIHDDVERRLNHALEDLHDARSAMLNHGLAKHTEVNIELPLPRNYNW